MTFYPDEPHPDNEHEWKRWWVAKVFDPERPFSDWDWVHSCWKETKANWHTQPESTNDPCP
jgi:hypothetical protein